MDINPEQWILNTASINSAEDLALFVNQLAADEGQELLHKKWNAQQRFGFLIQIRDERVFRILTKMEFHFDLLKLILAGKDEWQKLAPNRDYQRFSEYLASEYHKQSGHLERMICAHMQLVWEVMNGNLKQGKLRWLQQLLSLHVGKIRLSKDDIQVFQDVMSYLFPDIRDVFKIFIQHFVSQEDFLDKPVDEQKSHVLWLTSIIWNVYKADRRLSLFYEYFLGLFQKAMASQNDELVFFLHQALGSVWMVNAQSQHEYRRFNDEVEKPLSVYMGQFAARSGMIPVNKTPVAGAVLKIGFVVDRIVFNSPFKVLYSLLKSIRELPPEKRGRDIQFYLYDFEHVETSVSDPSLVELLKSLDVVYQGFHDRHSNQGLFYSISQKLKELRAAVVRDDIDILIPDSCTVEGNFLFSSRSAPVQLFWSHGDYCYDISGVDGRFTHGAMGQTHLVLEGQNFQCYYHAMDPEFYCPHVDPQQVMLLRSKFPSGKIILGSISRNAKVDSESYLNAVFKIMNDNPDTIYLACGAGSYDRIRQKFIENGFTDRFFYDGYVDPHVYGHILDLFLDTFPCRNGESKTEFRAKGGICVFLVDEYFQDNLDDLKKYYDWILKKYGSQVCENGEVLFWIPMAFDENQYVAVANRLIRDAELRHKVSQALKLFMTETMFDMSAQARTFLELMLRFVSIPS